MKLFKLLATWSLAVGLIVAPASAQSDYPSRTVTIIIPFGAGGGTDNLIRTFLPQFQEALGTTVVVDNRPGAASVIGTEAVARAAPDGYTVLAVDSSILINPALRNNLPYDTLKDLEPVSLLATGPVVLVAHPDAEADSLGELLELARQRPGELAFASGGYGAAPHLAIELMQKEANVKVNHIPYQGTGPATTDLVAGHVHYMFNGLSATKPHLDSGALKALAITGDKRHPAAPDVPTFTELGYPKINPISIWGAWVPAGTPDEIKTKLSEAFSRAVRNPKVADTLIGLGYFAVGSTPDEYRQKAIEEIQLWSNVVKTAGIKLD